MRIVHFSDTHLGHQQFSRTAPSGINQREQDHYDAFTAIIEHCIEAKPDVVIHSGDLFDGVRPSNRALHVALTGFHRLDKAGIPVVVIAGNHEHPRMLETGSPMRLFDHLDNVHAIYKGRRESIQIGETWVHGVPQCPDNHALRQEVESIPADQRDVLVLHGGVLGMDAFHHAEFNELSLDPSWFSGFQYVALGHYHGMQEIAPNAWYAGAPDRVSIRESGQEKGFLEIDLGKQVVFHPLQGRPYVDLPIIKAGGLDGQEILQAAAGALTKVPDGAVARLRIEGISSDLRTGLDVKAIRKAGAHALDLDLRLGFADQEHLTDTSLTGFHDAFENFAQTYPIEDLDRERLLGMARELLQ